MFLKQKKKPCLGKMKLIKHKMKTMKIKIRYDDQGNLTGARPYLPKFAVLYDNYDIVSRIEPLREKLKDLGVEPGMRFYILEPDEGRQCCRNSFEAVWSEERLIAEAPSVCETCEHYKTPDWGWNHCSECGDGWNITGSFFVNEKCWAVFDDPENNEITGR